MHAGVSNLHTGQVTVALHDLLLTIEGLSDHTHEQLDEEHADDEDEDAGVEDQHWLIALYRLIVRGH